MTALDSQKDIHWLMHCLIDGHIDRHLIDIQAKSNIESQTGMREREII